MLDSVVVAQKRVLEVSLGGGSALLGVRRMRGRMRLRGLSIDVGRRGGGGRAGMLQGRGVGGG